jgi:hypothetical protein
MSLFPRPDKLPEWASIDSTDPITGQPNVVEPANLKKQVGWYYKEPPPANWFNWLMRYYYRWAAYFSDQQINVMQVYGIDTSSTPNQIIVSLSPQSTELVDGRLYVIKIANNNTGICTLNIDGLGALPIVDIDLNALPSKALKAGTSACFIYNAALNSFILQKRANVSFLNLIAPVSSMLASSVNTTSFLVTNGYFINKTKTSIYNLSSNLTKKINFTWSAGDGGGALPQGLTITNNTWYHIFALSNVNGLVDLGIDSDINGTNLLADSNVIAAGFTEATHILADIKTNATGNIIPFYMMQGTDGRMCLWKTAIRDVTKIFPTTTVVTTLTTSTPLGVIVNGLFKLSIYGTGGGSNVDLRISLNDLNATVDAADWSSHCNATTDPANSDGHSPPYKVKTNNLSQISETDYGNPNATSFTISIVTYGWVY